MSVSKKYMTAWNFYIVWTSVTAVLIVVIPFILGGTSSGGEQKPLIWLSKAIEPVVWGYLIVSIVTSIMFKEWLKEYWYINLAVFALTAWVLFSYYLL